ncbi:MAG TPA: winged helix-turn-helix domain-containing protein [Terriglobales bacterium]|nr:winged helix-turn-helix domain-containing protein [Terriglobales bacterium]
MTQENESGHLVALLGMARQPRVRQRLRELSTTVPRMARASMQSLLFECTELVVRDAATTLSASLDTDFSQYVAFHTPTETAAEIRTPMAVLRRLDRVWGGPPLVQLDILRDWKLTWPGPSAGRLLVMRGKVSLDGKSVPANQLTQIETGSTLLAAPGALILWRRSLVGALLDAAAVAGLDPGEILKAAAGSSRLRINPTTRVVKLRDRAVRLTLRESAALDLLSRKVGAPVTRHELASALALSDERGLDRVMLGLRNKLGDGWITTVYGVGYALDS